MVHLTQHRPSLTKKLLHLPASAEALEDPLRPILASIVAGCTLSEEALPAASGLMQPTLSPFLDGYFPGYNLEANIGSYLDIPELIDLVNLLLDYRAGIRESEVWLAYIIAYSCAGRDHLWQDLGLANRNELSMLMQLSFPALAALNTGDMKWKKFIYRQYCLREGIYVCTAPSCGQCNDYQKCFSPEE